MLAYLPLLAVVAASTTLMFWATKGPSPNDVPSASEVAARTMSPFCPGLTIEECPSSPSADLRARIEDKVEQGYTNAEIDRWLVDNYGEAVLANPESPWAGVVPKAALPAGILVLAMTVRRWSRDRATSAGPAGEPLGPQDQSDQDDLDDDDDPMRATMREEFRRFSEQSQG